MFFFKPVIYICMLKADIGFISRIKKYYHEEIE